MLPKDINSLKDCKKKHMSLKMKPCLGLAGNWSLPVIIKCGNQISFITSWLVVLTA